MKTRTASILDKACATVPLAAVYANSQGWPSKQLWAMVTQHFPLALAVLILISAFFAAVTPLSKAAQGTLIDKRVEVQRCILNKFGEIIQEARSALKDNFDITDLGLHVWQTKRQLKRFGRKRLKRISLYRFGDKVVLQQFDPGKGQGVVGTCWKVNKPVELDVAALAQKASDETAFNALADSVKMGLTWKQFDSFKGRGSIFASPIRKKKSMTFRGCVSLDYEDNHDLLTKSNIPRLLNGLASDLRPRGFEEM